MKVIKTTDGKFAIVARTQVRKDVAIWSPIDERRWDDELSAQDALMRIRWGIPEPKTAPAPKPKATIDRSHLPLRDSLRITKLDKKVFVVEINKGYGWEELKTFKTKTKAEEWCATNSR